MSFSPYCIAFVYLSVELHSTHDIRIRTFFELLAASTLSQFWGFRKACPRSVGLFVMYPRSSYLPLRTVSDPAALQQCWTRSYNMLSPRRLRVILILAVLMFLATIFVRLDKHLATLPAQFRQFTQHNVSSETGLSPKMYAGLTSHMYNTS